MSKPDLLLSLIQSDILWERKHENLQALDALLAQIEIGSSHIIVLPEMFSTGFSMQRDALAESMEGETVRWMQQQARQKKAIVTGSLMIEAEGAYFNRLLWVLPNGQMAHYDKRHLFSYAQEDRYYQRGEKRVIAQVNGWKICLNICYDLRFPVWARNTEAYDIYLNVANWPQQRNDAWETLLKARAIENMCYSVGVNRVGEDPQGNRYIGNSSVYGPMGELIGKKEAEAYVLQFSLQYEPLQKLRERFSFLEDADQFILR